MLQLSNQQLIQAAQQFKTPLYVYHLEKITEQYNKLKTAFNKPNTKFFYACKALTNINILNHIKTIGCNIDCSSINEVKLALHIGFKPNNILYTSNGICFTEIEEAQNLGVHITIDSLSNFKKFGEKYSNTYPVSIRLRPNIMAGGNLNISTGHDESKFGIPITQLNQILAIVELHNINVAGLHIHTGSEISDVEIFMQGINVLFGIIKNFANLTFIDLGSGFKVKYKTDDKETDIALLASKIYTAFAQNEYAKKCEIWFEPGKFLVSECGYFIAKVNVIKNNEEADFIGIDSGFNHLIRPMFYGAYHTIKNISNPTGAEKKYAVVGNLCETDTFAWQRNINEVNEGDLLCFYNAGAYGFEMSSNFNSRFKPAEAMYKNNTLFLIRERDEMEDLLKKQQLINNL
jgi:diaminopimelate decarboxylase